MNNANFIPLGDGNRMAQVEGQAKFEGAVQSLSHEGAQEKVTGKTKGLW